MTKSRGIIANRFTWSKEQEQVLRDRYPTEKTQLIADDLGIALQKVYQKAKRLGLEKTAEYLASPAACRLRAGDDVGAAYRFQKGGLVWNKGMKGLQIAGCQATQFKAGRMPHNTLPIGSYRHDKDGTLQRKISNDKGNNSKRWRGVHELVWVEANGPVPPKHIVIFKTGMRVTVLEQITIDRVECISLAENMRRNTVHNMPKELAELVQLRGAVNRQINKRTKKNEQRQK